jgi:hypothetical protein
MNRQEFLQVDGIATCRRIIPSLMIRPLSLILAVGVTFPAVRIEGQQASGPAIIKPADEQWRNQFKAGAAPLGSAMNRQKPHPGIGKVTYTLHQPKTPTADEVLLYAGIAAGMDEAIRIYNTHTKLKKALNVHYNPSIPTADGNINGTIRLGRNARNARVCMHEICHTMGVGQHRNWGKLMVENRWQGKKANALLQEFTKDPKAQLHGDRMHFWPYGLNYDNEVKSDEDLIRHAKIVEAIVDDLEDAS